MYREAKPTVGNVGETIKPSVEFLPNSNSSVKPRLVANPQPLKNVGAMHYAVIQVILANAPNAKAAQVWEKFENKIKIGAADMSGVAYHFKGNLFFDINEIAKGDAASKPYQNLFHEGGHNIDFLNAQNGKYFSERYKNGALLQAINDDFSDLLSGYTNGKYNLGIGHEIGYWERGGEAINFEMKRSLAMDDIDILMDEYEEGFDEVIPLKTVHMSEAVLKETLQECLRTGKPYELPESIKNSINIGVEF